MPGIPMSSIAATLATVGSGWSWSTSQSTITRTSRPWPASIERAMLRTRGSEARVAASSVMSIAWLWWATIIVRYSASARFQSAPAGGGSTSGAA